MNGVLVAYDYNAEGEHTRISALDHLVDYMHDVRGSITRIDEPLGIQTPTGQRYLHGDRLGSIVAVTGNTTLDASYAYSPYGQTLDGPTGGLSPFRYTAREYEADDLYYYRARYYDPTMRRFLSEDPIGFAGGDLNLYAYVGNDPVNWIDPYGKSKFDKLYGLP